MTMTIMNNTAAVMSLGELNKNISQVGKQLKKLSSGMRLNSAGDDASGYSISEKMRVRIRALGQDERNVQNGASLLRVAEGGIQNQLEIMKTIKEKVIDADNDTNTDLDRATIQKEIDQSYQQIETIAWDTTYNGKRLLVGDTVGEKVRSWVVDDKSSLLPGSDAMKMIDMNMIDDKYESLNGIVGPFDLFTPSKIESASLDRLGFSPIIQCSGGVDNTYTFDGSYTTVASFEGKAFQVGSPVSRRYILTASPSNTHKYGTITEDTISFKSDVSEIDISGCSSVEDVMVAIKAQCPYVSGYGVNTNGLNYIIGTDIIGKCSIEGYTASVDGTNVTGLFSGDTYFSGGQNSSGVPGGDADTEPYVPGVKASFSLSGLVENTGITVYEERGSVLHGLRFTVGNLSPTPSVSPNGVVTVGVDYSGTFNLGDLSIDMDGRNLTITAPREGTILNEICFVRDGIANENYVFESAKPLLGTFANSYAYATVDVSGYTDVEELITDLTGKAIAFGTDASRRGSILFDKGPGHEDFYHYYEFVDSASDNPLDGMLKINRSVKLDLNVLRTDVANGKTAAKALWDLVASQHPSYIEEAIGTSGETIGIKVRALRSGSIGNTEKIALATNQLRSYTLDYGKWFDENPDVSIPSFLNNKGFRVYCASCSEQWFNFHFITEDLPEGRPQNSDPDSEDIKHIYIDVSGVTDATSLVQAIYDQATPQLTSSDPDLNHFMRLAVYEDQLIVYDERRLSDAHLRYATDLSGNYIYEYQWDDTEGVGGAKIADGVWDNVAIGERNIYVRDLIIQDTDHASMNIRLRIPQTTMDHLFGYQAGTRDLSEFNVLTSESREELLGNKAGTTRSGKYISKDERGLLDAAIDYLTNANTLVGAQIMRLEMTESNIVTQEENTTSSESTIRDADMAMEMAEYMKANVLSQASQSMLAQANQNGSAILSLLQ